MHANIWSLIMLSNEDLKLKGVNSAAINYVGLPIYEVEFILAVRRMVERCDALQRINNRAQFGDRRASPGRRSTDRQLVAHIFA